MCWINLSILLVVLIDPQPIGDEFAETLDALQRTPYRNTAERDALILKYQEFVKTHGQDPRIARVMKQVADVFLTFDRDEDNAVRWYNQALSQSMSGTAVWTEIQLARVNKLNLTERDRAQARKILEEVCEKSTDAPSRAEARFGLMDLSFIERDADAVEREANSILMMETAITEHALVKWKMYALSAFIQWVPIIVSSNTDAENRLERFSSKHHLYFLSDTKLSKDYAETVDAIRQRPQSPTSLATATPEAPATGPGRSLRTIIVTVTLLAISLLVVARRYLRGKQ